MKPNLHNPYGYKVCYKEKGCRNYIRRFITRTYREAKEMKEMYLRFPSLATLSNRPLKKPEWVIIPIKKSEVRDGIWHEVPFWKQKGAFLIYTKNNKKEDLKMITLNLTAKGTEQELIKKYLEENASETLAEKINNGVRIEKDGKTLINKKSLDGFMKYATDEAKKLAAKGASAACVRSDVVFGWAIHYFEEESIIGKLYNDDGSEYKAPKPIVKKTTTTPTTTYTPPVVNKPQSEQLSLFDFSNNTPVVNDTEETIEEDVEETIETVVEEPKAEPIEVGVEEDPKGSPLFQKYMAIQNEYPDYIVCMRVGDFYEVFGYGAVQVSELIELTLTSRDMGLKNRVPMVGFPYHRADVYYDKLTDKGLTLVIAENDDLTVKSSAKGTVNVETGEVIEMPEEPKKETMDEKRKREEKELIAAISGLFGNDLEVRL